MAEINFFKPTPIYKEYRILDMISQNESITQRMISDDLDISVSMVNQYLEEYEENGYLIREYYNLKNVNYVLTKKGIERKRLLNIWFLKDTLNIFKKAKEDVTSFLNQIIDKGITKVLFYGAGEVAEIMLQAIVSDNSVPLKVVGVIDDDKEKQGRIMVNVPIISKDELIKYNHDAIVVSSYVHREKIINSLKGIGYDSKKIVKFFE